MLKFEPCPESFILLAVAIHKLNLPPLPLKTEIFPETDVSVSRIRCVYTRSIPLRRRKDVKRKKSICPVSLVRSMKKKGKKEKQKKKEKKREPTEKPF